MTMASSRHDKLESLPLYEDDADPDAAADMNINCDVHSSNGQSHGNNHGHSESHSDSIDVELDDPDLCLCYVHPTMTYRTLSLSLCLITIILIIMTTTMICSQVYRIETILWYRDGSSYTLYGTSLISASPTSHESDSLLIEEANDTNLWWLHEDMNRWADAAIFYPMIFIVIIVILILIMIVIMILKMTVVHQHPVVPSILS